MPSLDLHMHSSHSMDGEFTPAQLMEMCAADGISVAALSDHNTTRGVAEAADAADRLGIRLIPAVELDCAADGINLHILGYGIDPDHAALKTIEENMHREAVRTSGELLDKLAAMGIHFERDAVLAMARDGAITGEMAAEVAFEDERNRGNPLFAPYLPGGPRSDNPMVNFELDICSGPQLVKMDFVSGREAVDVIHQAGGQAVVAHPGYNLKGREHLIEDVVRLGIDGIETYSNYHKPEQTALFLAAARKHGLLATMGSDFHGRMKPAVELGRVKEPFPADQILAALKARGLC